MHDDNDNDDSSLTPFLPLNCKLLFCCPHVFAPGKYFRVIFYFYVELYDDFFFSLLNRLAEEKKKHCPLPDSYSGLSNKIVIIILMMMIIIIMVVFFCKWYFKSYFCIRGCLLRHRSTATRKTPSPFLRLFHHPIIFDSLFCSFNVKHAADMNQQGASHYFSLLPLLKYFSFLKGCANKQVS